MKMITAIIRPNAVYAVTDALSEAGFAASTRWTVSGRGKQKGIQVGDVIYDEMTKNMLVIICDDEAKNEVIDIIMENALTGSEGSPGDGRIFVTNVEESYTISEQTKD